MGIETGSKKTLKYIGKNILEIGSSHDTLYNLINDDNKQFTIVEPNYNGKINKNLNVVSNFFDSNLNLNNQFDTIIHSHFLEHIFDYDDFRWCLYSAPSGIYCG